MRHSASSRATVFDVQGRFRRRVRGRIAIAGCIAGAATITVMVGEARAGCSDGACGRVDWTEVTDMDQGAPAAAKLHGAYAWEASKDSWATHPLAGTVSGYFWLSCLSPSGSSEAVCRQQLASEMGKAGTDNTFTVYGWYYSLDAGVVLRPPGLFEEGESGTPQALADLIIGGSPMNAEVCRTALAMPRNDAVDGGSGAGGSGVGGAGPAPDATTGGAAGGGPAPTDDGGCSASGRGAHRVGFAAFAAIAAAVVMGRRRSRV